ncbi:GCN5-related N-acetyltransferase [Calothrix sp. NIES-4071]|nr:GCN5-related N-acetyltransferase [Calothrix sp. NIES-4071]BAZ57469.1 GCN5-related N-acetyltransferase [Calothrix sp. NIES-4105]
MSDVTIRFAQREDCDAIFSLIQALAEYEKLSDAVTGDALALKEHLFGMHKFAEVILAICNAQTVGFALFLHNYSTFLTKPGIYLEDLFVLSEYRRLGIGKALLSKLAQIALERNCGRLEWSVLDWNEPAIEFYRRMGAEILGEWRICRVTGTAITNLATLSNEGASISNL